MDEILRKVKEFADTAHGDQERKYSPERYIAHPVRVMETCRQYNAKLSVLAAALLHDVLEDTAVDQQAMENFLESVMSKEEAAATLRLVIELTDVYTRQLHPRLNRKQRKAKEAERISQISADAQTIKYADIMDNCKAIASQDTDFAPVFLRECKMLLSKMDKGNKALHNEALKVVEMEQEQLKAG